MYAAETERSGTLAQGCGPSSRHSSPSAHLPRWGSPGLILSFPRPAPVHLRPPGPHPAKGKVANRLLAPQLRPFARVSKAHSPGGANMSLGAPSSARVSLIFFESPRICPSSSLRACSSPALRTPRALGLPKSSPPVRVSPRAFSAQRRPPTRAPDLSTLTCTSRASGGGGGCTIPSRPGHAHAHPKCPASNGDSPAWQRAAQVPSAPFGHTAGTPTKPKAGRVAPRWPRGCVANFAASPSSSGPPSSPAFWRSSAAPLPSPCWSTTPRGG